MPLYGRIGVRISKVVGVISGFSRLTLSFAVVANRVTRIGLSSSKSTPPTQWLADAISRTTSSGTVVSYPLYDAHGNGVGFLSKSGTSWSLGDERTFDAWGRIRSGSTSDNKGRYCANLGHKQDDESDLTYMRARYYEPASGRFVCEDTSRDGSNWYVYVSNNPIRGVDYSGKMELTEAQLAQILEALSVNMMMSNECKIIANAALNFLSFWLEIEEMHPRISQMFELARKMSWITTFRGEVAEAQTTGCGSVKEKAEAVTQTYAQMILLALWVMQPEDDLPVAFYKVLP